jgi:hypothetical protein
MKAIAFGNRLSRDFGRQTVTELTADARLEIVDAINGALQRLDALAQSGSKTTTGSFYIPAPATVSLGLTNGSTAVTIATFTDDQYGATIRINGDDIDNQVAGPDSLLHPYGGATGTVSAVIYGDAIPMPEPYLSINGNPEILEDGCGMTHHRYRHHYSLRRDVSRPRHYWVEANAANRSPIVPAIIRFHPLPDQAYRLQAEVVLAPARVRFSDLLAPSYELPIRAEYVEQYLLPVARGILTTSELWKNPETKSAALSASELAESKYRELTPSTFATPSNLVGTPCGY